MLCFAGYMYQNSIWVANNEPAMMTWLPDVCLFLFCACSTVGYMIVPWVMIGEVFPSKIRGIMGGITWCFAYFFIFITLRTYPFLENLVTKPGTFFLYGIVSLLVTTIFLYFFFPETKGKTLNEIEILFKKNKT